MGLTEFWQLLQSVDSEQIKRVATDHTGVALLLCFFSGVLTSFTPCVYPMIPITINIFGRISQKSKSNSKSKFNWRTFFVAGIYVAGMCVTYSVMGLLAGLTGSLFGNLLQSSYMLAFLTILFLALALSQLGIFKFSLPGGMQSKLSQVGNADSYVGIFLMGLISGLIVSPCVGPVIAGILAFVFDSSNALRGFLYFLSFSLGLGMLFLFIGGFSGALSALPKSGNWMTRINRILASLMLLASCYYGFLWSKNLGFFQGSTEGSAKILHWIDNEEEAFKIAKEKMLPIVVDFTAVWCEACHVLDKTVLSNPKVAGVLKNFVLLRIDISDENEKNEARRQRFGVMSLPTILFVDTAGKTIEKPQVRGVITPDEFLSKLAEAGLTHTP